MIRRDVQGVLEKNYNIKYKFSLFILLNNLEVNFIRIDKS